MRSRASEGVRGSGVVAARASPASVGGGAVGGGVTATGAGIVAGATEGAGRGALAERSGGGGEGRSRRTNVARPAPIATNATAASSHMGLRRDGSGSGMLVRVDGTTGRAAARFSIVT